MFINNMPAFCFVNGCSNRSDRDINKSFYRVPKVVNHLGDHLKTLTEKRRQAWVESVYLKLTSKGDVSRRARVCSDHFVTGRPSAASDVDSQDWAPTINIWFHKRKKFSHSVCQTDLTMEDLSRLEEAVAGLNAQICITRKEVVDTEFNPEAFQDSDKTRFFTGLPDFSALVQIFQLCEPYIATSTLLSKFQQFILVLMRLRLDLEAQDLACRFKVSSAMVSKIWVGVINILHERLGSLIEWPERDVLRSAMPESFTATFGDKVAVILDCFEVFIKKPINLSARAQTQWNYKDRNTVKFLIGLAPCGKVTYVSRAWGGMASVRQITEECGVLKNLCPGDVVLTDRGFNSEDGTGLFCATYTNGKMRLSAFNMEKTELSSVREHVEKVTGSVQRKYQIMQSQAVPIEHTEVKVNESAALIDKVAIVCCALSNLSNSTVPLE